jgi:hypothetical protein
MDSIGQARVSRVGREIPMKYVFRIAVIVAVVFAGWTILEPEITNIVFQEELHDLAAQPSWRPGMSAPNSDEDLRIMVIRKAEGHDILLDPKQVTVRRNETPENPGPYIAVDYTVPVNLFVYSYSRHFRPSSTGGRF